MSATRDHRMFNGEEERAFYSEEKRRKRSVVHLTNRAQGNQIEVRDYREGIPDEKMEEDESFANALSSAWGMMTPDTLEVDALRPMGGHPSYRAKPGTSPRKVEIIHLALLSLQKPSTTKEIFAEISEMGFEWTDTEKVTRCMLWQSNRFLPLGKGVFIPDPRWYGTYSDENDTHMKKFIMTHCANPIELRDGVSPFDERGMDQDES